MISEYVNGYVYICYTGTDETRFINLCNNNGIDIWNVNKGDTGIYLYATINSLYQMKKICRKCGGRLKIQKKTGLPFLLRKYSGKAGYLVGFFVYLGLLYIMSLYVWNISFDGNFSHTDYEITGFLKTENIKSGDRVKTLDCDKIEFLLRQKYSDVTWVSAEIKGTKLIIHMMENYDKNIAVAEDKPYNLVSDVDGRIASVVTRAGVCMISPGEDVKKGQMLISGTVNYTDDSKNIISSEYVNSDGDIYAYVIIPVSDSFSLDYDRKIFTGRENKMIQICVLGKKITMTGFYKKLERFETLKDYTTPEITKNYTLPVNIIKAKYREYKIKKEKYTPTEAKKIAENKIDALINKLQEKGIQIIENNVTIDVRENECVIGGDMLVIQKIGQIEYIEEKENNNECN